MFLKHPQLTDVVGLLEPCALPEGVFAARGSDPFRSDATAWAILAMSQSVPNHALIMQRGEAIATVRTNFELIDTIPAQQGIRLI